MLDKTVNVRLDEKTYQKISEMAGENQTNISDVIRSFIEKETDKEIKISEKYEPIARKILMVDYLTKSKIPKYDRDMNVKAYVIPKMGQVPERKIEKENLILPLFRIATNPTWDIEEDFDERIVEKAIESIQRQEDGELFKLLDNCVGNTLTNFLESDTIYGFSFDSMYKAKSHITEHELTLFYIISNPNNEKLVNDWIQDTNDEKTINETTVLLNTMCPKDKIFMTAPPKYVGVLAIKQDITSVDCDEPKLFKKGKVFWETIGMAIMQDYAVSKIVESGFLPVKQAGENPTPIE